jgi:RNA-directed DNA polymerase
MPYITFYFTPQQNRVSYDNLFQSLFNNEQLYIPKEVNTPQKLTVWNENPPQNYPIQNMILVLTSFWKKNKKLLIENMQEQYDTFHIPKHSGGLRRIDAPKPELMKALSNLKDIFEMRCHALAHNAAYAYVKQRSTLHALQVHQNNESRWFLKLDAKDFFPSCNPEFVYQQLIKSFPFSEIVKNDEGELLKQCLSLGFLNNGLPQGTPLSPLLTNLIMVPVDYKISNTLRNFDHQNYIYTRYADDFLISCKYKSDYTKVIQKIEEIFQEENCPFHINPDKTRYGSSAGRNWNLGLMLNKDNNITIGYRKKERFKAMLHNFLRDLTDGKSWPILDVQILQGLISYYHQIEPEYIDYLLQKYTEKFNTPDIKTIIKTALYPE